jgi:hypothetical protein
MILRTILTSCVLCLTLTFVLGCGGGGTDSKQPKLSGTPDPKITGPAQPGAGGASSATLP